MFESIYLDREINLHVTVEAFETSAATVAPPKFSQAIDSVISLQAIIHSFQLSMRRNTS